MSFGVGNESAVEGMLYYVDQSLTIKVGDNILLTNIIDRDNFMTYPKPSNDFYGTNIKKRL